MAITRSATACSRGRPSWAMSGRARRRSRSGRRVTCSSGPAPTGVTSASTRRSSRSPTRSRCTAAHTTNDSIVWIPDRSVLFCGDLIFNGGTPFLLMGSVTGAVDVLEQVLAPLGARLVVPGHGPVFEGTGPLDATLDYLRFVLEVAVRAVAAGVAPLAAARDTDLDRFAGWADPERIVGNLHRACAELTGTPRGGPIDVPAALADMVAYNGGAPLTCLA